MSNNTTICVDLAKELFQVAVFNKAGKVKLNKEMSAKKMCELIAQYPEAARYYGFIRALLKKEGNLIGNNNLLIASHSRSIGAVLVTNNTKEFSRIPDLTIENWAEI